MRAWPRKHHVTARRLQRTGSVAVDAARFGDGQAAAAATRAAALLTRDGDRPLAAGERLLEGELDRLMNVNAALRAVAGSAALLEDVGEQIAERRRVGRTDTRRKIEPFESERLLCRRTVNHT